MHFILYICVCVASVVRGYSSFTDVSKIFDDGGQPLNYSVYTGYIDIDIAEDARIKCSMFY
jgi:hypothetical protein